VIFNKHHNLAPEDAVYVGRPTIFGNPFTHLSTHASELIRVPTRERAVERYREWFHIRMADPVFEAAVESLRGKDLVCWCAPLPCHAEVIVEYLESTKEK
jgi:hypothetical protein